MPLEGDTLRTGYNIFQISLEDPIMPTDWSACPVAWCLGADEAYMLLDYLQERFDGLYFFITRKEWT